MHSASLCRLPKVLPETARVCLLALALLLLALAPSAAQPSEPGTISGRVRLTGRVRGTPLPSNAYQPRTVHPRIPPGLPEIRNVVVYLKGQAAGGAAPMRGEIRQAGEAFLPRVVAVTRGSSVDFPNDDPFYHNVFSLSGAATFDLGRYAPGKTRSQVFRRPGLVKVYCRIHSHMSASILVLDHPHFTVPDLDGAFTLNDVPPGTYSIVGWHERIGERTSPVHVPAGGAISVDLSLPADVLEDDR
jgi:plastocyanin